MATSVAEDGRVVVDMVVGIKVDVGGVGGWGDEAGVGEGSEVEEDVWKYNDGDHGDLGGGSLDGEYGGKEEIL